MEKDWVKLGKAFKAAREWRGMTQEQVATAIGVDESTIQNLETARYGRGFVRMPGTAPLAAAFYRWSEGDISAVLAGGDPPNPADSETEVPSPEAPDLDRSDLPLRIVDELKNGGRLVDTAVIRLPTKGDVRMTVVVRGAPDASPEEIRQALQAWRRAERQLQDLPNDDDDEPRAASEA
ncbi:helix-turn-helix transcriptional regulator [Streptomyces sp. NBC_01298]|uniref:helix-turn-helix transcriptional regulator n=1 Tax=Streptomyces sp. NBC_01298 TaxID=2903817 RepID=UPI002E142D5C|nr:helix-turn-helix transcriptional regulator [Streptomyces sp. NBC_01298]